MDVAAILSGLSPKNLATAEYNAIRKLWDLVSPLPGGKQIFSRAIGYAAPYTGSIHAKVEQLRVGYAEVRLLDRPELRNHLASVHAVALVNLAELAGNAALAYSLPDDARFIVAGLSIEYLKKARGTIRATSECPVPPTSERKEYVVPVSMWNTAGEEVARAELRTLVGPKSAGRSGSGSSNAG
jgi:acyl-coenzyme A thioesterase PaaI-like protein